MIAMKKKKLEALPTFPMRECGEKPYKMVANLATIEEEEHLICDIYERNEGDYRFRVRATYTAGDWGLYWASGKWSRGSIEAEDYTPVYDVYDMLHGPGLPKKATWANTAIDQESIETIRTFALAAKVNLYVPQEKDWHKYLTGLEQEAKVQRAEKAMSSRKAKLRKRIQDMPELPADLEEWADKVLFHNREYVYYKRSASWADCHCSKCGADYRIRTSRLNSFEGQLMRIYPIPIEGMPTNCEMCGVNAIYKPRGRVKESYEESAKAYVIQPFREGAVIRYLEMNKLWIRTGKSEVNADERNRTYIGLKKPERNDWHLYDDWRMSYDWHDQNVGGYGNIPLMAGEVYMNNTAEWDSTRCLKYSGFKEYLELMPGKAKPTYYFKEAEFLPIERLVKMGMIKLVQKLVEEAYYSTPLIPNRWAKDAHKMLGIRRARLEMLRENEGEPKLLRVLQAEKLNTWQVVEGKRKGKGEWTEEQIWKVYNLAVNPSDIKDPLCYMSITQFLNRIEKYSGREIPSERKESKAVSEWAVLYMDYIEMRVVAGYGMDRETDIYPRDLRKAHNDMVLARNRAEREERVQGLEKEYPEVKRRYRGLKAVYGYKAEDMFIRPAKNIREIVEEGALLHHCVGSGDGYIKKHARGDSFILFCRNVKTPNDPYITIEIRDYEICQWYGMNDKKPDREHMEKFLAKWLEEIQERARKREGKREDEGLKAG